MKEPVTPELTHRTDFLQEFGNLFKEIQLSGIFGDSITFNDCVPKFSTGEILWKYETEKTIPAFDLSRFLLDNFELPDFRPQHYETNPDDSITEHIDSLWDILTRAHYAESGSSLIPLPHPYVVPGGRFRGLYYWDSYFTSLGLIESGKHDLVGNILDNFAFLIDTLGFIPNANRTYYLGRSQPPVFALMIELFASIRGPQVWDKYLPFLEKEYEFWMRGAELVSEEHPAELRVVRLAEGVLMNRYWDNSDAPRPESYREDVEVAKQAGRSPETVFRHIRAAAESGWDFSSRWFKNGIGMEYIHTTDILPVDLNCLILYMEQTLLNHFRHRSDKREFVRVVSKRAEARKRTLKQDFWDEENSFFQDFDWVENSRSPVLSLAGVSPLYFRLATSQQAKTAADVLEKSFLQTGGFVTTLVETGQQWDFPNGWAPLHWMVFNGLKRYGHNQLARKGIERWLKVNEMVYRKTGKMTEKYNMVDRLEDAQGGEYPNQDGFGWTNGVYLKLSSSLETEIKSKPAIEPAKQI